LRVAALQLPCAAANWSEECEWRLIVIRPICAAGQDLGIGIRDMAAGLGIGLGRLLSLGDGTASEDDKTFYRIWLSRIEGWSAGHRNLELQRARSGSRFK
jgi:hypothetical protein